MSPPSNPVGSPRSTGSIASTGERIFAYGTLLLPEIMKALIGRRVTGRGATLRGYARFVMRGETFPAIIPDAASETRGLVFDGISSREFEVLDAYEGDMYARLTVRLALDSGATADALAYVLLPQHRDQLTDRPWDCERFAAEELSRFLEAVRAGTA